MFGHFFRKFDDKGRVMIPAKFREELSGLCYITIDLDNIMVIRSAPDFNTWKNKLLDANTLNADARKFMRMLLGRTLELQVDKQGRINLPDEFIQSTNLTKEVAFVGVGNKIEIWSQSSFKNFQKQFNGEDSLDNLAKRLLDEGVEL